MKNRVLLTLLLLGICVAQAQVTLSIQVPPTGVVQKSQLWNMVLVNNSNSSYDVNVAITLLSTADNNPVMTASSRLVTLTKGPHQLKYSDFTPVNYQYLSSAFNGDMRPEGFLPVGNYRVCYSVSRYVTDYSEAVAEDCMNLEIQPLSPPILNTPADNEVVSSRSPQFTWLPPAPLQLFGDLSYDILIAKIGTGQSALSAIQQNLPVLSNGRTKSNFLNYPASAALLDTGVNYAWCVVARNNNQVITQSDVWSFSVSGAAAAEDILATASYVNLQREVSTAAATCVGDILLAYNNRWKDSTVSYSIRSLDATEKPLSFTGALTLKDGMNLIQLSSVVKRKLESKQNYLFELTNSHNERWSTRIVYYSEAQ